MKSRVYLMLLAMLMGMPGKLCAMDPSHIQYETSISNLDHDQLIERSKKLESLEQQYKKKLEDEPLTTTRKNILETVQWKKNIVDNKIRGLYIKGD